MSLAEVDVGSVWPTFHDLAITGAVIAYGAIAVFGGFKLGRLDREERRHDRANNRARVLLADQLALKGTPVNQFVPLPEDRQVVERGRYLVAERVGIHRVPEPVLLKEERTEAVPVDVIENNARATWWFPHLARRRFRDGER